MKKLITLTALLLCAVVSSWGADSTPTYAQPGSILDVSTGNTSLATTLSAKTWNSRNNNLTNAYEITTDYVVFSVQAIARSTGNFAFITQENASGNTADATWEASGPFKANTYYYSSNTTTSVKLTANTRMVTIKVTGCTGAMVLAGKADNRVTINAWEINDDANNAYNTYTKAQSATIEKQKTTATISELDQTKTYVIQIEGSKNAGYVYGLALARYQTPVGAVDPEFSLTKSTVVVGENSQVQVGTKGNLDGITLTGLTSSDPTVATVNTTTGEITTLKEGSTTISFTASSEVTDKYNATSTTVELPLTVNKPQLATPTITPSGTYYFAADEKEVSISGPDDASVYYTTDGSTPTASSTLYSAAIKVTTSTTIKAIAIKDGFNDSEVATATFNKITLDASTAISGEATWDWSKYGTKEINTSGKEFNRADILVANVAKYGESAPAPTFGPASSLTLNGDYIVRDNKYCQVTHAKFTTTVSGTISVEFSNTGGSRPYRYLYVNGVQTSFKTNASNSNTTATGIHVNAGEVDIYGVLDPEAATNFDGYNESTHGTAGAVNFLRIYNITFTPDITIPVSAAGYATFYTDKALDFTGIENITAYTATNEGSKVTFNKVTGAVPAETGLLVKADEGNYPIPVAASAEGEKGIMVGTLTGETIAANNFVLLKQDNVIGFYRTTGEFTARANSAWLPASVAGARVNFIGFDEEGEVTGIEAIERNQQKESVFNLNGQRVAQPSKGLYIVNGKKVVLK